MVQWFSWSQNLTLLNNVANGSMVYLPTHVGTVLPSPSDPHVAVRVLVLCPTYLHTLELCSRPRQIHMLLYVCWYFVLLTYTRWTCDPVPVRSTCCCTCVGTVSYLPTHVGPVLQSPSDPHVDVLVLVLWPYIA